MKGELELHEEQESGEADLGGQDELKPAGGAEAGYKAESSEAGVKAGGPKQFGKKKDDEGPSDFEDLDKDPITGNQEFGKRKNAEELVEPMQGGGVGYPGDQREFTGDGELSGQEPGSPAKDDPGGGYDYSGVKLEKSSSRMQGDYVESANAEDVKPGTDYEKDNAMKGYSCGKAEVHPYPDRAPPSSPACSLEGRRRHGI